MNIVYQLIKGFRLTVSIPAAILVHIGYKIAGEKTEWGLVVLLFFITGLVMLQNDYFDRDHDKKKGKDFAYQYKNLLLTFLFFGWATVVFVSLLFPVSQTVCLMLIIGIGIGITYSLLRKILLLPVFVVATLSASPLVIARADKSSIQLMLLFFCVFLSIFGRELLKDIEDKEIDIGYKKTLLTAGIFSEKGANIFAGVCISLGAILSLSISKSITNFSYSLYLAGISLIVSCVFFLIYFNKATLGKRFFDGGMFLILLALSI